MLFKVLSKASFVQLVDLLLDSNEVVGPRRVAQDQDGRPIHQFLPVASFDEMDLDYETTEYSAKTYFLPFSENLSTYRFEDGDWEQEIRYRIQPRAIIGLHACDINALRQARQGLRPRTASRAPTTSRGARTPSSSASTTTRARTASAARWAPTPCTHGFDLFLTDLGRPLLRGHRLGPRLHASLQQVDAREVTDDDTRRLPARCAAASPAASRPGRRPQPAQPARHRVRVATVWKKWGDKCLSCGSCAMVCPTCYCYGVERASLDGLRSESAKIKQLYSCNLVDFAEVAGGHNFRPDRETRLKYRYYHQHRGFVERLRRAQVRRLQPLRPRLPGRHQPAGGDLATCRRGGSTMTVVLHPYDVTQESEMLAAARLQPARPAQARRPGLQGRDHQHHPADRDGEALPHPDPRRGRARALLLPARPVRHGRGAGLRRDPDLHLQLAVATRASSSCASAGPAWSPARCTRPRRGARVGIRGPFGTHFPHGAR